MRAGVGLIEALLAKSRDLFRMADLRERPRGGTPGIPHSRPHPRARAHAPNDGHWHMRFHRSRS